MSGIDFADKMEGEEVKYVFRRSIWTARRGFLFLIAMVGIGVLLRKMFVDVESVRIVGVACCVLGILGAVYALMLWYYSIYIVTNRRIKQVIQKGILRKTEVDYELWKMKGVEYKKGLMGGKLIIDMGEGEVKFSMVPKVEKVYNEIQNAKGKVKL